jgi:hypothetical protein
MKWFKHMSHANSDDKLVAIRVDFGMWGVGVYWTLVELVAAQMKPGSNVPEATFKVSELVSLFGCKRSKLVSFLKAIGNQTGTKLKPTRNQTETKWTLTGNILVINIPKLLEIKDNFSSNLQVTCKPLASIEKEVEKEKEREEQQHHNMKEVALDAEGKNFEQHLLTWWGDRGRIGWGIKQSFVMLAKTHGWDKVYDAVQIAAEYDKKSLAYVRGILEPKQKGDDVMTKWVEEQRRRNAKTGT